MVTFTKEIPTFLTEFEALDGLVELQYRTDAGSIEPAGQRLRVIEGTAWISLNGEDYILYSGDTLLLEGSAYPAVISALGRTKLVYTLAD